VVCVLCEHFINRWKAFPFMAALALGDVNYLTGIMYIKDVIKLKFIIDEGDI